MSKLDNQYFIEGQYRNVYWSDRKARHFYKNEMGKKICLKNHINSYVSRKRQPIVIIIDDDTDTEESAEQQTVPSTLSDEQVKEEIMQTRISELKEVLIEQLKEKSVSSLNEKKEEIAMNQLELFAMEENCYQEEQKIRNMTYEELISRVESDKQLITSEIMTTSSHTYDVNEEFYCRRCSGPKLDRKEYHRQYNENIEEEEYEDNEEMIHTVNECVIEFRQENQSDPKKKRKRSKRSKIERDNDNTFAKCSKIVITETVDGDSASITLTRMNGQTKWSKTNGAWRNCDNKSYNSPNDAWKDLIKTRWGENGTKKFNGANVWDKIGRMVVTTNSGEEKDMFKYPYNVLMFLDKCEGKYRGKDFSEITMYDFTQLE